MPWKRRYPVLLTRVSFVTTCAALMLCSGCGGGNAPPQMNTAAAVTPLYVTWTIDCAGKAGSNGTPDQRATMLALRATLEAFRSRDLVPTLFMSPGTGRLLATELLAGMQAGTEIAMLFPEVHHLGYVPPLERLSPIQQLQAIQRCRRQLNNAFGTAPTTYRAANLAATADTFSLLVRSGFTQGSVSLPGRILPENSSVWLDADPFPHWASAENRLVAGTLPFLELPVTVDLAQIANRPPGMRDIRQLRLERRGLRDWAPGMIRRYLAAQKRSAAPVHCLTVITHNFPEFGDRSSLVSSNLTALASIIRMVAADTTTR